MIYFVLRSKQGEQEMFKNVAWLQVMLGQVIRAARYHPMADLLTDDQLRRFLSGIKRTIAEQAEKLSDHRHWISSNCAASSDH